MDAETHELIAAYALDALDEPERRQVEEILATSEEAREELRSFSEVAAALAVGVAGIDPPPELRERIVAEARAEGSVVVPLERPARRRRLVPTLSFAAAAAAVVAVGFGVWAVSLNGDLDDARAALALQEQTAAVLADPQALDVELAAGSGRLVVGDDGGAVLVVDGLVPATEGQTYQVWVVEDGAPRSAGLFAGSGSQDVVLVSEQVGPGAVVAVTVEEAGGADAPTTTPVVASQPV